MGGFWGGLAGRPTFTYQEKIFNHQAACNHNDAVKTAIEAAVSILMP